jgi:hypothetical protein
MPFRPSAISILLSFASFFPNERRIETRSDNLAKRGFLPDARGERLSMAAPTRLLWLVVMVIDAVAILFLLAACGGGGGGY